MEALTAMTAMPLPALERAGTEQESVDRADAEQEIEPD